MTKFLQIRIITIFLFLIVFQQAQAQLTRDQYIQLENALGEGSFFSGHLTGFMLYDLDSQRVLYEKNSQINFIPASTTKLFTLFAALAILQDSTQTLRYLPAGDTLKIWGAGDPSWKYLSFRQPDFEKIWKNYRVIQFSDANQVSPAFGYGWQWDDYYYDYSAERSPLPIAGNLLEVKKVGNRPEVLPSRFQKSIRTTTLPIKELERDFHSNTFSYNPSTFVGREKYIPLLTSGNLTAELAQEITGKKWIYKKEPLPPNHKVFRGAPLVPLLQEMMLESDNFIAEQMLWMVSDRIFKTLDTERAIEFIKKTYFFDLPDQPKWVDGSGLSRHNLFTPRSMVGLIEKLYRILPEAQLYQLLPTGGKTGTLKNSFQAAQPYVFAKTGTISNHYSLVGIIKTNRGKTYAFAFMNSNYLHSASAVRREVEKVMIQVRDFF
ncbi:D-alanyl-D-alanine carboxypeptidase / D-alanyl-D-alanine-endopeptidase (penicillin-binding protein 4) [Algoriphagus ornithinivorans]|uniref:D-alanyl-D-alanine carboxypeptidase / D-alanyl-D-alanine-endopeptidase (Penicillin-binding protein 4) n=1 Tax=Algoriphagus ornithinivorans TaxID=226506 RepID=A0A1I5H665_9BACT|nr:D-alanyl-D-alanine carboxypeptidase [Algoriphagus ornithinivorans]SFO43808.1 D-alanyl-D-alanine carboxypeptidase / D-alanyl-D-alanine-endopeptidase (penicillin-binding protein 4) [Algoriphagus ornithinivorans]